MDFGQSWNMSRSNASSSSGSSVKAAPVIVRSSASSLKAAAVFVTHNIQDVMREMEKSSLRLKSTVFSSLPECVEVSWVQNSVLSLLEVWRLWKGTDREQEFRDKYGPIDQLLYLDVDYPMVQAMIQFWDPEFKCFTFNEVDLSPTIDEYEVLFEKDLTSCPMVYHKRKRVNIQENLQSILGSSQMTEISVSTKDNRNGVSWTAIKRFIIRHNENPLALDVFALAIYGLLIFPRVPDHIDAAVVDLFERIQQGVNPVPTVLAETIRALNFCRRQSQRSFTACVQILYVWMQSHFECYKSEFSSYRKQDCETLIRFQHSVWPNRMGQSEWIKELKKLSREQVVWRAPWFTKREMLYQCGEFSWVPLVGIWGIVVQAPVMFLRQMGAEQFVPAVPELVTADFEYGTFNSTKKVEEVRVAWTRIIYIHAPHCTGILRPSYADWLLARGKPIEISEPGAHLFNTELTEIEKLELEFEQERKKLEQEKSKMSDDLTRAFIDSREKSLALKTVAKEHKKTKEKLVRVIEERNVVAKELTHQKKFRGFLQRDVRKLRVENRILQYRLKREQKKSQDFQKIAQEEKHKSRDWQKAAFQSDKQVDALFLEVVQLKEKESASQFKISEHQSDLDALTFGRVVPSSPTCAAKKRM